MNINELKTNEIFDKLIITVMNYYDNEDLLESVPHRKCMDLAIVPVIIDGDINSYQLNYINNDSSDNLNVSDEFLVELALSNSRRLYGVSFKSMNDYIDEVYGFDPDMKNVFFDETDEVPELLYILSNQIGFLGASVIFYKDMLKAVYQILGQDFYMIPSSVHEVLVTPAYDSFDPERIKALISVVNTSVLKEDEYLSDNLYFYDSLKDKLTII